MHTSNTIFINAPIDRIFELACDIQKWPVILPHYQSVTVSEQSRDGYRKVATMHAIRTIRNNIGIPVGWSSVQICDPEAHQIYYKHIGGATRGMWVVWTLETDPWDRGVLVTITHDLRYPLSLMNGWIANQLIGQGFVYHIADDTLSALKTHAERFRSSALAG